MSLGFNHNRKYRSNTLPGTVNPTFIRERRAAPSSAVVAAVTRRKSPPTLSTPSLAAPSKPKKEETPLPPPPDDTIHTVFATVAVPLRNAQGGAIVADVGSRVVLVYPMASDPNDGHITMNLKSVNPNTAQLSYTTVTVYDPNTETRHVTNFSLIP